MLATPAELAAVPVLTEMLDPKSVVETGSEEEDQPEQDNKRIAVMVNGLRAVRKLAAKHPGEKLSGLRAVEQLELRVSRPAYGSRHWPSPKRWMPNASIKPRPLVAPATTGRGFV